MADKEKLSTYHALFGDGNSEAKARAFDAIAEQFYAANFGRLTKSDFEVLLFHLYIEQCMSTAHSYDDYTLSKELGITQSRVRSLKVKKELQYPHEGFDWKQDFIECISRARYDEKKALVKVQISDVNVLAELRNYVEKKGWYDEYQLNTKLFQCRADIFIDLCNSLGEKNEEMTLTDAQKKALKKLGKESEADNTRSAIDMIMEGNIKDGLKKLSLEGGKGLLVEVIGLLPGGTMFGKALKMFLSALTNT